VLNINKKKTSEIWGESCITIAGKPTILEQAGRLSFEISPTSFYQVNPVQMVKLYDKALEYAGLTGEETVLDLYCGVGTIGLYCAIQAKKVIGIESLKSAVMDANRNAVINGIVNAEFICGKAEEELPKLLEQGIKADVVILDPPRSGCDPALLDALAEVEPSRIVYVSCDPATLARDIKILCEKGYEFKAGAKMFLKPRIYKIWTEKLPSDSSRKFDYYLDFPCTKSDTTEYQLPEGFTVESLPKGRTISSTVGQFTSKYWFDEKTRKVFSTAVLEIKLFRVPAPKYQEAKQFFDQVLDDGNQKIILLNNNALTKL